MTYIILNSMFKFKLYNLFWHCWMQFVDFLKGFPKWTSSNRTVVDRFATRQRLMNDAIFSLNPVSVAIMQLMYNVPLFTLTLNYSEFYTDISELYHYQSDRKRSDRKEEAVTCSKKGMRWRTQLRSCVTY